MGGEADEFIHGIGEQRPVCVGEIHEFVQVRVDLDHPDVSGQREVVDPYLGQGQTGGGDGDENEQMIVASTLCHRSHRASAGQPHGRVGPLI